MSINYCAQLEMVHTHGLLPVTHSVTNIMAFFF
uniref:Uncharacterized protein n=1 Tax=Anguilla anguilla TaxID=7936 RepID=A0A0E9W8M7_ANGAN